MWSRCSETFGRTGNIQRLQKIVWRVILGQAEEIWKFPAWVQPSFCREKEHLSAHIADLAGVNFGVWRRWVTSLMDLCLTCPTWLWEIENGTLQPTVWSPDSLLVLLPQPFIFTCQPEPSIGWLPSPQFQRFMIQPSTPLAAYHLSTIQRRYFVIIAPATPTTAHQNMSGGNWKNCQVADKPAISVTLPVTSVLSSHFCSPLGIPFRIWKRLLRGSR